MLTTLPLAGCSKAPAAAETVRPSYSKDGRLTKLEYDSDGDGKVDTWGYMDGARLVRVEVDENGDGKVDRWEYHNSVAQSASQAVDQSANQTGASRQASAQRGASPASDLTIDRIERATRHDGRVSRREYFENGLLARVEEDTDGDGKVDKWETYVGGALSMMALDESKRGTPDRRLVYKADGSLDRIETDPDHTGHFQTLPAQNP